MFRLFRRPDPINALTPLQVREQLAAGSIALVDVREDAEWSAERIPGAVNVPLSCLEADGIQLPEGKRVVLHCLSGARSRRALGVCRRIGLSIDTHMEGGIAAWKACGLPTER